MIKKAREMGLVEIPTLAAGAMDKLINYSWPGNVRELQNAVERALILSKKNPLIFDELVESARNVVVPSMLQTNGKKMEPFDQAISRHIMQALEATGGRVGGEKGTAKLLNMNASTLRTKMRKLGIPFGEKR